MTRDQLLINLFVARQQFSDYKMVAADARAAAEDPTSDGDPAAYLAEARVLEEMAEIERERIADLERQLREIS